MNYDPGKCNIGPEEISRRYRIGYLGACLTFLGIFIISLGELPRMARLVMLLPVGIALAGFVQGASRFCLAYGLGGVFSIEGRRKLSRITDQKALRADRQHAWKIILIIVGGTAFITAIYYFIP